jgi:hypothetical protein
MGNFLNFLLKGLLFLIYIPSILNIEQKNSWKNWKMAHHKMYKNDSHEVFKYNLLVNYFFLN